jgi:MFS family permease
MTVGGRPGRLLAMSMRGGGTTGGSVSGFYFLRVSSGAYYLGLGLLQTASPLLASTLSRNPVVVAGVMLAQQAPLVAVSLISGAMVDRLDQRQLLAGATLLCAVAAGVLGVFTAFRLAGVVPLYAATFAVGAGSTTANVGYLSFLPALVPRPELERANAWLSGIQAVAQILIGSSVAGLLFVRAPSAPFGLASGALAAASALAIAVPGAPPHEPVQRAQRTDLRQAIAQGVAWLRHNRLLGTLALTLGVMNLTNAATTAIMVLFAESRGVPPQFYGLLLACEAVGSIAASVLAQRVLTGVGRVAALKLGVGVEALTSVGLALAAGPLGIAAMLALFGFNAAIWGILTASLRQERIPRPLLGRVQSVYALVGNGSAVLGAPLGGLLAHSLGLAAPFWFAAGGVALVLPLAWRVFSQEAATFAAL